MTHATTAPAILGSTSVFGVVLPAASLLAVPSDLLEGLLAHQFLRYVWDSVAAYRTIHPPEVIAAGASIDDAELARTYEATREMDQKPLASSEGWLSERLRALAARLEDPSDAGMKGVFRKINDDWIKKGLPTRQMPATYPTTRDVTLDVGMIDRHRSIIAPDPAVKPFDTSVKWVESGPAPILDDLPSAVLMVRIGLAYNALISQLRATKSAEELSGAARMAFVLSTFVTTAALTNESLQVARSGMPKLRRYAASIGVSNDLLERVGKLLSGKHPACEVLGRARNQLGFHWDEKLVEKSVRDFGRNKNLVWLELDPEGHRVDRLAADVLAHALIPGANQVGDVVAQQLAVQLELDHLNDALNLVLEFFTACTYGYLLECRASATRERASGAESPEAEHHASET